MSLVVSFIISFNFVILTFFKQILWMSNNGDLGMYNGEGNYGAALQPNRTTPYSPYSATVTSTAPHLQPKDMVRDKQESAPGRHNLQQ